MLKDSLAVLAATPPPRKLRHLTYPQARHRVMTLCQQLGIPVDQPPEYHVGKANARVAELEQRVAQRSAQVPAATAPAATQPTGPVVTAPSTARPASEYLGMTGESRAEFAASGGQLSRAAFDSLTPRQRTDFCRHGGTLASDLPNGRVGTAAVTNDTPPAPAQFSGTGELRTRAAVEAMDPRQKMEFFRAGGQIVNL